MKKFETIINSFGALIGITILVIILLALTSCSTFIMTEQEKELNYKIDKLYLDYNYKRDSLIIEYHNIKNIK